MNEPYPEFIDKDGYVCYRTAPHKRISKHRYVYEAVHGKTEKNECIIFLDGNRRNFDIDNLYKLTRSELVILNKYYGISDNPCETLTNIAVVKLKQKRIAAAKKLGLCDSKGNIKADLKENRDRWVKNHPEYLERRKELVKIWKKKKYQDPEYRERENQKRRERRLKCSQKNR